MLYQDYGLPCVWWRLVFQVKFCPARVTAFLISEEGLECQVHVCPARVTASLVSEEELVCQVHFCLSRITAYTTIWTRACQGNGLPTVWTRACQVNVCLASVTAYQLSEQELPRLMSVLSGLRPTHCLNKSLSGKCLSCQGYGLPTVWPRSCQANVCLARVTAYLLSEQELAR